MNERNYWIALHEAPGIGAQTFYKLLEFFKKPSEIWKASPAALDNFLGKKTLEKFVSYRKNLNPESILDRLHKKKVQVITLEDENYPSALKEIYDPPPVLYVKGSLEIKQQLLVAVVGSRRATFYGKSVSEMIGRELALREICVVSGMARGIDSFAQEGALRAGGMVVAVLGCGLDIIYPRENKILMEKIAERGALVSEYPLGTLPKPGNFPARNRVISGLSLGTVVVEAAAKSGALITADFSLEQGREVFAVPGPITSPYSIGTNNLIKQGAKLVLDVNDILEELEIYMEKNNNSLETQRNKTKLNNAEEELLRLTSAQPVHIDFLSQVMNLRPQELYQKLMVLQLNGHIRQLPGKYFLVAKKK